MPKKRVIRDVEQPPAAIIKGNTFDKEYSDALALFSMGFGPAEIEQRTGVRQDKIRQWVHRDNWNAHKLALEQAYAEKHPPLSRPLEKIVATSRKDQLRKTFIERTGEMAAEDAEHWKDMAPEERLVVAPAIAALNGVHRKNLELDAEAANTEKGHISLTFLTNAAEKVEVIDVESEKVKPSLTMEDF